jgi:hypothetical protein
MKLFSRKPKPPPYEPGPRTQKYEIQMNKYGYGSRPSYCPWVYPENGVDQRISQRYGGMAFFNMPDMGIQEKFYDSIDEAMIAANQAIDEYELRIGGKKVYTTIQ